MLLKHLIFLIFNNFIAFFPIFYILKNQIKNSKLKSDTNYSYNLGTKVDGDTQNMDKWSEMEKRNKIAQTHVLDLKNSIS